MKRDRNVNLDILRAFLALMIIVLHFNNPTMGGANRYVTGDMTGHWLLVQGAEALCVMAVNCFVMISGFFLSKVNDRRLRKVADLFGKTIGYSVFLYVVCLLIGLDQNSLSLFIARVVPTNYFVALYSVLYLISPLINLAFERLDDKQFQTALCMLLVLFSIWPTVVDLLCDLTQWWPVGVSPIAMQGNDQGYTITNFCLCYVFGAYIRWRYEQNQKHSKVPYLAIYIATSVMLIVESRFTSTTFYYSNILVIISAAALLQFFLYHSPMCCSETVIGKIFAFLGSHSLDVFLIHTNPLLLVYFWRLFSIPEQFAQLPILRAIIFLFKAVGSMYALCIVITLVYHFTIQKLICLLWKRKRQR